MNEEDSSEIKPGLRFDLINSGEILASMLAIRLIISELAIKDREPEEALKYIGRFKAQMEKFIASIDSDESETLSVLKRSMVNYTERLLAGIQFEREKK